MNTRMIVTTRGWFGGGGDLTPMRLDTAGDGGGHGKSFHAAYQRACDRHDPAYYAEFKAWCDRYFYLPHRGSRGAWGGSSTITWTAPGRRRISPSPRMSAGRSWRPTPPLCAAACTGPWTRRSGSINLIRRGRYVEFNLLHDRGTLFGLKTGGNT